MAQEVKGHIIQKHQEYIDKGMDEVLVKPRGIRLNDIIAQRLETILEEKYNMEDQPKKVTAVQGFKPKPTVLIMDCDNSLGLGKTDLVVDKVMVKSGKEALEKYEN